MTGQQSSRVEVARRDDGEQDGVGRGPRGERRGRHLRLACGGGGGDDGDGGDERREHEGGAGVEDDAGPTS
jgi:hypothetical protein